jgi:hypothetical protein
MALYLQSPQFPGRISLPEGTTQGSTSFEGNVTPGRDETGGTIQQSLPTPEEDLAPAQEKTKPAGFEFNPLRTLFGRFSVRISLLVAGSLVVRGMRQRAAKEPRDLAKVRLAKAIRK